MGVKWLQQVLEAAAAVSARSCLSIGYACTCRVKLVTIWNPTLGLLGQT